MTSTHRAVTKTVAATLLLLGQGPAVAQAQESAPYSLAQVLDLLRSGVPEGRIIARVTEPCLTFDPAERTVQLALRNVGASSNLIAILEDRCPSAATKEERVADSLRAQRRLRAADSVQAAERATRIAHAQRRSDSLIAERRHASLLAQRDSAERAERQKARADSVERAERLEAALAALFSTDHFAVVPSGRFVRARCPGMAGGCAEAYTIELSQFQLAKTEITVEEWEAVMHGPPAGADVMCRRCPVVVNRQEAEQFVQRLNGLGSAARFRLPTEAEWEYAARGNGAGVYPGVECLYTFEQLTQSNGEPTCLGSAYTGGRGNKLTLGWVDENKGGRYVHEVGLKPAHAWGLRDMVGNAPEWVSDMELTVDGTCGSLRDEYSQLGNLRDPRGPSNGVCPVSRGNWPYAATFRVVHAPQCSPRRCIAGIRLIRDR